jgi:hypothetical protein
MEVNLTILESGYSGLQVSSGKRLGCMDRRRVLQHVCGGLVVS